MSDAVAGVAHPLVRLARMAVAAYILHGQVLQEPQPLPPELAGVGAVFVCLKRHGALRGCIGTVAPQRPTIAQEVISNAIGAAARDPRFAPVTPPELPELSYSVDLLHPPEPVRDLSELDPQRYGVIVTCGRRRGLLLPHLPGIVDARTQVELASEKAGIVLGEPVVLERFLAERFR